MQGKVNLQTIPLGKLAVLFDESDRTCVFLNDQTGNSFTFFKYKARLIDVGSQIIAVGIGKKSKQDAIETIRKGLTFGLSQGEITVLHVGDSTFEDVNNFLKGSSFWEPKELFKSPDKIKEDWFRSKVMKPSDKDIYGNQGSLYPNQKYRIFLSSSKNIEFSQVGWLKGTEANFVGYRIQ